MTTTTTTVRRTPLINGTSLKGYISCTYNQLVAVFGAPDKYNDPVDPSDKVNIEWCLKFPNGTVATIYAWKRVPQNPDVAFEWNVGGYKLDALECVDYELFKNGVTNHLTRTFR